MFGKQDETYPKIVRKHITHLMQIHVLHHVMNHGCFEKYLDSEKKRYFFQNQKIGCQVRGEATLSLSYTILSKKLI